ncbi:MAG: hypothetical protein AAGG44_04125, partial [Planctomycetota bacterium]
MLRAQLPLLLVLSAFMAPSELAQCSCQSAQTYTSPAVSADPLTIYYAVQGCNTADGFITINTSSTLSFNAACNTAANICVQHYHGSAFGPCAMGGPSSSQVTMSATNVAPTCGCVTPCQPAPSVCCGDPVVVPKSTTSYLQRCRCGLFGPIYYVCGSTAQEATSLCDQFGTPVGDPIEFEGTCSVPQTICGIQATATTACCPTTFPPKKRGGLLKR